MEITQEKANEIADAIMRSPEMLRVTQALRDARAIEEERDALRSVHDDELKAITRYRDKIATLESERDRLKVDNKLLELYLSNTRKDKDALTAELAKAMEGLDAIRCGMEIIDNEGVKHYTVDDLRNIAADYLDSAALKAGKEGLG